MEKDKDLAKFSNDIVERSKITSVLNLTIHQKKYLRYLIINEKNNKNLNGMPFKEVAEIVGLKKNLELGPKKKFIEDLSHVQFKVVEDINNMSFENIFTGIRLRYNKLSYTLNPEVQELLEQPKMKYFISNYDTIKQFKHDYSIEILDLLEKEVHANQIGKKNLVFNLTWLKEYLGLENSYNHEKGDRDLRVRVLEPSLMEISEYTDITIEGEYNKKTKKMQLSSKIWGQDKIMIGGVSRKSTMTEKMQEQKNNYDKKVIDGRTKEPTTSVEDNGFKLQPFQLTDNQSKFLSSLIHSNLIEFKDAMNIKSQEEFNDVFKRFYKRNDMSNNFIRPSFEPVEELKLDSGVDIDDLIENAYKPKKLDNNGSVATDNEQNSLNNAVIDEIVTETDTKEIDKYVTSYDYVLINTSTGKKLNNKKMYYTLKDKSKYKFITLKEYNFDAMKKKFNEKVTNRKV